MRRLKVSQTKTLFSGFSAIFIAALLALPSAGWAAEADSPTVDWGRDLYMSYCVSCHGWTGKGDGPAGLALKSLPTDLTQLRAVMVVNFRLLKLKSIFRASSLFRHMVQERCLFGVKFLEGKARDQKPGCNT